MGIPDACGISRSRLSALEGDVLLSPEQVEQVFADEEISGLLEELNVHIEYDPSLFDLFDSCNAGVVNLSELLSMLLKLRGQPQKIDMVAPFTSLRTLHEELREIRDINSAILRQLGRDQSLKLSTTMMSLS